MMVSMKDHANLRQRSGIIMKKKRRVGVSIKKERNPCSCRERKIKSWLAFLVFCIIIISIWFSFFSRLICQKILKLGQRGWAG